MGKPGAHERTCRSPTGPPLRSEWLMPPMDSAGGRKAACGYETEGEPRLGPVLRLCRELCRAMTSVGDLHIPPFHLLAVHTRAGSDSSCYARTKAHRVFSRPIRASPPGSFTSKIKKITPPNTKTTLMRRTSPRSRHLGPI